MVIVLVVVLLIVTQPPTNQRNKTTEHEKGPGSGTVTYSLHSLASWLLHGIAWGTLLNNSVYLVG